MFSGGGTLCFKMQISYSILYKDVLHYREEYHIREESL